MWKSLLSAAALVGLVSGTANASTIVGSETITSNLGNLSANFVVENLINQSGLSSSYISGVTDFDSFVSTTTHANPSFEGNGGYASRNNGNTALTLDIDLGSNIFVTKFALWNDSDDQALGDFELFSSIDNSFASLVSLGSFSGAVSSDRSAQVFDIANTSTQFLRLVGDAVDTDTNLINFGEIAFEGSVAPIPVPAALPLFATALGGLAFFCRRKRRNAA